MLDIHQVLLISTLPPNFFYLFESFSFPNLGLHHLRARSRIAPSMPTCPPPVSHPLIWSHLLSWWIFLELWIFSSFSCIQLWRYLIVHCSSLVSSYIKNCSLSASCVPGAMSSARWWGIQLWMSCIVLAPEGSPHTPTSLPFQIEKIERYPSDRKDEGIGRNWKTASAACVLGMEQHALGTQILIFL